MPQRLPHVLTGTDLPLAELLAARLDGEVFAVGTGFAPVDELEQPAHRAAALANGVNPRLIAEQHSAAWVWGALPAPPLIQEFCTTLGTRVAHRSMRWATVREVVIDAHEVAIVGGVRVTTPLRTAVDLARFSEQFGDAEVTAVGALMTLGDFGVADCLAQLDRTRNLPFKTRAVRRFSLS